MRLHVLSAAIFAVTLAAACDSSIPGQSGGADAGEEVFSCDLVDTDNDPQNCGECGRTCIIPNAEASCSEGECGIARCDGGYVDSDGMLANGCEETGAVGGEACNVRDDNGDGQCDEGAIPDCRVGVHRSSGNGHLYTTDLAAASSAPFNIEASNYFYLYAEPAEGLAQAFLCRKNDGRFFLTVSNTCEGAGTVVLSPGFWATAETCGAVPLYRSYNGAQGNHFYTTSLGERDNAVANLGYIAEGISGYVWPAP